MTDPTDKTRINLSAESHGGEERFAPGNILVGKYKVISMLGTGGMGTVYRVQQVFLNKAFALKTLDTARVSDVLIRRFQQEARAAASLSHPNLVQVHDFGLVDDEQPYLVMDLVDGITLAELLKTRGAMSLEQVGPLFAQICFGLAYAHDRGVVHRDIKPSNIMLVNGAPAGTEGSVKVVDFGIAKLINTDGGEIQALTRTGDIFGSPLYMSPEQCSGGEVDHRADIYALGCVLFETLTGTPPHVGSNSLLTMMSHQSRQAPTLKEASLGREFPAALEEIVAKMLRKLPAERYQNLGLVAHDLAGACTDASSNFSATRQTAPKPKPAMAKSGNKFLLLLAVVLLTSTVGVLAGYFLGRKQDGAPPAQTKTDSGDIRFMRLPKDPDYSDRVAQNIPILAHAQTIKSTIVTEGGSKKRKFVFPECGIGTLRICDRNNQSNLELCAAKGSVSVPADLPLMLEVGNIMYPGTLETPAIFDKIDPNEFCGLSLIGAIGEAPSETQKMNLVLILRAAAKWPNLRSLELHSLGVNKAVFDTLNTMEGLRNVVIEVPVDVSSADLARLPFLHNLETLELRDFDDGVAELMPNLAGSSNLNRLILDDTLVSASSLLNLSKCTNLNYLEIGGQMIADDVVQSITRLKSLRVIVFSDRLSQEQLEMLIKCPWIDEIRLTRRCYNKQTWKQWKALDPRIRFIE